MKHYLPRRFLPVKLAAAVMLYLGLMPLFLLCGAALMPQHTASAALAPLPALALAFGAGCVRGRLRKPLFAVAIVFTAALFTLLFLPARPLLLLLFVPTLLLLLLLMPAMSRPLNEEWTASQAGMGIVAYLFGLLLAKSDAFAGAGNLLSWFFSAYLLMCVFFYNRLSVAEAAGTDKAGSILSHNRRLLALCCLIAVPLANLDALKTALEAAAKWLARAAVTVALWLSSLFPISTQQAEETAAEGGGFPFGVEATEPSAFAQLMEKVAIALAILLMAALVAFALYKLWKHLRLWLVKVRERFQAYSRKIAGYEDASETLFHWNDVGFAVRDRLEQYRRRVRAVPWERLSAREKVRRVYALLLKRSGAGNEALTAREALAGGCLGLAPEDAAELASLYEEARYSNHPVSDTRAQAIRKKAGL